MEKQSKTITISYSNLTDWTWLAPEYKPFDIIQNVTLGQAPVSNPINITLNSIGKNPNGAELNYFAFGQQYSSEKSYFANLTTNGAYVTFSTLEPGMSLSPNLFKNYKELMKIISHGYATCPLEEDSICTLPNTCEAQLIELWDQSFKLNVQSLDLIVPLATFAVDGERSGKTVCEIRVA